MVTHHKLPSSVAYPKTSSMDHGLSWRYCSWRVDESFFRMFYIPTASLLFHLLINFNLYIYIYYFFKKKDCILAI